MPEGMPQVICSGHLCALVNFFARCGKFTPLLGERVGMDITSPTATALKMAARKPKPGKKRTLKRTSAILTAAGVLLFGGILIAPAVQAHLKDAIEPTVAATDSLAAEAQTLTEEYETICQDPAWAEAEALTAGTGSGEAFDAFTSACTSFAVENADYVEKVESVTGLFTGLGDGFGEVTETVRAAVASGDIESAIRILFAQSEEAGA